MVRRTKRRKESKLYRAASAFLTETYESSIWKFATFFLFLAFTGLTWTFTIPEQIIKNSNSINKTKQDMDENLAFREYFVRTRDGLSELLVLSQKESDAIGKILNQPKTEWKPQIESLVATYTSAAELEKKLRTLQVEMRGLKFYSTEATLLESEATGALEALEFAVQDLQIMAKKLEALKKGNGKALIAAIDEKIARSSEFLEHLKTTTARLQSNLRAEEAVLARVETEKNAASLELEYLQLKLTFSYVCLAYITGYLILAGVKFRRTWKATK